MPMPATAAKTSVAPSKTGTKRADLMASPQPMARATASSPAVPRLQAGSPGPTARPTASPIASGVAGRYITGQPAAAPAPTSAVGSGVSGFIKRMRGHVRPDATGKMVVTPNLDRLGSGPANLGDAAQQTAGHILPFAGSLITAPIGAAMKYFSDPNSEYGQKVRNEHVVATSARGLMTLPNYLTKSDIGWNWAPKAEARLPYSSPDKAVRDTLGGAKYNTTPSFWGTPVYEPFTGGYKPSQVASAAAQARMYANDPKHNMADRIAAQTTAASLDNAGNAVGAMAAGPGISGLIAGGLAAIDPYTEGSVVDRAKRGIGQGITTGLAPLSMNPGFTTAQSVLDQSGAQNHINRGGNWVRNTFGDDTAPKWRQAVANAAATTMETAPAALGILASKSPIPALRSALARRGLAKGVAGAATGRGLTAAVGGIGQTAGALPMSGAGVKAYLGGGVNAAKSMARGVAKDPGALGAAVKTEIGDAVKSVAPLALAAGGTAAVDTLAQPAPTTPEEMDQARISREYITNTSQQDQNRDQATNKLVERALYDKARNVPVDPEFVQAARQHVQSMAERQPEMAKYLSEQLDTIQPTAESTPAAVSPTAAERSQEFMRSMPNGAAVQTFAAENPERAAEFTNSAMTTVKEQVKTPTGQRELAFAKETGDLSPNANEANKYNMLRDGFDPEKIGTMYGSLSTPEKFALWSGVSMTMLGLMHAMDGGGTEGILGALLGLGTAGMTLGQAGAFGGDVQAQSQRVTQPIADAGSSLMSSLGLSGAQPPAAAAAPLTAATEPQSPTQGVVQSVVNGGRDLVSGVSAKMMENPEFVKTVAPMFDKISDPTAVSMMTKMRQSTNPEVQQKVRDLDTATGTFGSMFGGSGMATGKLQEFGFTPEGAARFLRLWPTSR